MQREDDRAGHAREDLDQLAQPLRVVDVAGPVRRGQHVLARVDLELLADRGVGLRGHELEHVDHHVADDHHLARDVLVVERLRRRGGGAQQQRRGVVGEDAVELLGHRPVIRAHPGLDVRDRDLRLRGRQRSRQRRVRVAIDEDDVRSLLGQQRLQRRQHRRGLARIAPAARVQAIVGPRQPELVEEDPRQRVVVMLTRMDEHLGRHRAQALRDRRRFDELRPVADDG